MAFFDELGKKISQTSQSAITNARNMADTSKINSLINEQERYINDCFNNLGRVIYQKNLQLDDAEANYYISCINNAAMQINEYNKQINDIKGICNCPGCGAAIPVTSTFCQSCGYRLAPQPPVAPPMAQAPAPQPMAPAPQPMPQEPAAPVAPQMPQEPVAPVASEAPAPQVDPMPTVGTCPNCGAQVDASLNFCTQCGNKL